MPGWMTRHRRRRTWHVLPIEDLRDHDESLRCWCQPRLEHIEEVPQARIVVHNSADGRELVERHGVN